MVPLHVPTSYNCYTVPECKVYARPDCLDCQALRVQEIGPYVRKYGAILRTDVFYCLAHAHVRELTGFMWSAIGSSGCYSVRLAILALGSTRRMKTGHQNTTRRLVYLCFISNPIRFVLPLHYTMYVIHRAQLPPPPQRKVKVWQRPSRLGL